VPIIRSHQLRLGSAGAATGLPGVGRAGIVGAVVAAGRAAVARFLAGLRGLLFRAVVFLVVRLAVFFLAVRRLAGLRAAFLAVRRLAGLRAAFLAVRRFAGLRALALRAVVLRVLLRRAVERFAAIWSPPRVLSSLGAGTVSMGDVDPLTSVPSDWHPAIPNARNGGFVPITLAVVSERARLRPDTPAPKAPSAPARWRYALATGNVTDGPLDPVTRWIVLVRASVLPMTLTAGFVAGLLAWWNAESGAEVWLWAVATLGIICAHMANNLMNDLWDLQVGTDDEQYPRALYAPHPVLSGMTTRRGLAVRAVVVNLIDLAILVVLVIERGWPILGFALGGFLLSVAYTAPPLRLKKRGLGEPTVLVVWGPLMVGGTYYATAGSVSWEIVLASVPYALLCTAVLMGKHIDKIPWDEPDGTRTLPVILGELRARTLTKMMMASFYPLIALLIALGTMPILSVLCFGGLLRLVRVWKPFSQPKPAAPPDGFPIWPLWFAAIAFVHTRLAGALLVLGMFLGVLLGV